MTSAEAIVIVVAGALLTLLIGGALVYWIEREWRDLNAQRRRRGAASLRRDPPDQPDESPTNEPPES